MMGKKKMREITLKDFDIDLTEISRWANQKAREEIKCSVDWAELLDELYLRCYHEKKINLNDWIKVLRSFEQTMKEIKDSRNSDWHDLQNKLYRLEQRIIRAAACLDSGDKFDKGMAHGIRQIFKKKKDRRDLRKGDDQ